MNNNKKTIPIRVIIIMVFMIALLVSVSGIGAMVFTSWLSSAKQITASISQDLSERIYNQVFGYMHAPDHINESNHLIIENGILDLSDEKTRDMYFVGVLSAQHDEIYSFAYGTEEGEYYGARRNENGVIEIMRNNTETGGNSWYYSVNEDLTAGDIVVRAGPFDPREREWYKAAAAAGKPLFSPVYNHFIMNDMTISAAWPIYDGSGKLLGVMASHMLLSDVGAFLGDLMVQYNGYAVIVEKNTGELIANSMGKDNYTLLNDGTLKRLRIDEIVNTDILEAYNHYSTDFSSDFVQKSINGGDNLYINVREISMDGFEWILISSVPSGLLTKNILNSVHITGVIVVVAIVLMLIIYYVITGKLIKPLDNLRKVSVSLSNGDLSKRVEVIRNDEIGGISVCLNNVADKMQFLINNLETSVKERTEQLNRANLTLEESKNQLQLILDSTAEAIYGIDLDERCTFCNLSCVKMLGYRNSGDLLGQNMHQLIHHSHKDGTAYTADNCRIIKSIKEGKGFEADDEAFFRADGKSFDVVYRSYPQIKNGVVVGGVITFTDITERKRREDEILYLNYHDTLTGLKNRRSFENSRIKIDNAENLPLSVIFADVNGLKMTNDIFGHNAGDRLIKKTAEILKQACRENDMIARVGGDEFIILLPGTGAESTGEIISQIRKSFSSARIEAIKCSISIGSDTKTFINQSLEEIISNAENAMYKDKTENRLSINKGIVDTIVQTLHSRKPDELAHSIAVSDLCGRFGAELNLPETDISKLKRAGYLHDIGKIVIDDSILSMNQPTMEEEEKMRPHSVAGYRILNLFDNTLDLAEYVYGHHERWDGAGYPRGLKGEQIPLISRIMSIAECYDSWSNVGQRNGKGKKAALEQIIMQSGKRFDPNITKRFVEMIEKENE